MGFLTERERQILRLLKEKNTVGEIGKYFKVSDASISKSISNIRAKAIDLEDDFYFLMDIGFLKIKGDKIEFISRDKDPKALSKN